MFGCLRHLFRRQAAPSPPAHKCRMAVAAHREADRTTCVNGKLVRFIDYFERLECQHPGCTWQEWRECKCPAHLVSQHLREMRAGSRRSPTKT